MANGNGVRKPEFDADCYGRDEYGRDVFRASKKIRVHVVLKNERYVPTNCPYSRGTDSDMCDASQKGRDYFGICRWGSQA